MVHDVAYSLDHVGDHDLEHRYGERVHLVSRPYLLSQLATLCRPETVQPQINTLVESCYRHLLGHVFDREFPRAVRSIDTRMRATDPEGVYEGVTIDPAARAVSVNIARAGTLPSHVCYHMMNELLDPAGLRQDHLIMNRVTDDEGQVTGAGIHGSKIGGPIDDAIVIFPDPMGATGSSLIQAIDHYKESVPGTPAKILNVHLIVTPNYIRAMQDAHPEVVIYAIRLDRGASDPKTLETLPGEQWDRENGLNDKQYIVPGGGGFGEILNNSYV